MIRVRFTRVATCRPPENGYTLPPEPQRAFPAKGGGIIGQQIKKLGFEIALVGHLKSIGVPVTDILENIEAQHLLPEDRLRRLRNWTARSEQQGQSDWLGWTLAGTGAFAALTGGVFLGMASDAADEAGGGLLEGRALVLEAHGRLGRAGAGLQIGGIGFELRQPLLEAADALEVLLQPHAVGGAEPLLQRLALIEHRVEHRLPTRQQAAHGLAVEIRDGEEVLNRHFSQPIPRFRARCEEC